MKKGIIKKMLFCLVGLLASANVSAQVAPPTLTPYNFMDQSMIKAVSDNGKWAVSYGTGSADASTYTNTRRINIETGEVDVLGLENEGTTPLTCSANDVTDDGVVVGSYKGRPAKWTKEKGWEPMQRLSGWESGHINSVTPDGKYAVGVVQNEDWSEEAVLYDLEKGEMMDTPGLPNKGSSTSSASDMLAENWKQRRFNEISADGRYITGIIDFSYTWNTLGFIYDRETATFSKPGFNADGTPWIEGLVSATEGSFSPNGKWYGGTAYVAKSMGNEYSVPFRYNMETKEYQLYEGAESQKYSCIRMDDNGVMYGSVTYTGPIRSLYALVDNFWYPIDDLLKLRYGIDFYGKTGFDYTGTCTGVSGDGKVLASFPDPYTSYTLKMNESIADAARNVDLLSIYKTTPSDGSSVTNIKSVEVAFNYEVDVIGEKTNVKFTDKNGNSFSTVVKFEANSTNKKVVTVGLRTKPLTVGETYTLTIPAGTISLKGNKTRTNSEIVVHITGRGAAPVEMVSATPADGTAMTHIDVSTNPVLITYNTDVKLGENAKAQLYREGDDTPMAELTLATSSNAEQSKMVMAYPASIQYLYLGSNYKLVIPKGAVTDVNGDNPCAEHVLNYEGKYERVIVSDDNTLYSEDFNTGVANMLLRDGDGNTPNEEMQGYDFLEGSDSYAWVPVRDEGSNDGFSAASTSAYTPAGKSDDWMVTPQIFIPEDTKCILGFDAQGFRNSKTDKLKVIVYADDEIYNYLNADLCAKMRAQGKVVMDEQVLPGESEANLAGDWKHYTFELDEFMGKNIYVAFVNENEDQSLVIVDNILVERYTPFLTALMSETTVVAQDEMTVKGRVIANVSDATFTDVTVKLLDAGKNVVDQVSGSGLSLAKGDKFDFTFDKPLPLTVGKENKFYFDVTMGENNSEAAFTVKDLAFQPTKRVVIEEMTGMGCGNCPLGHYAWDKISGTYGDKVIMAAYHVYTGDIYESGMSSYVNSFLGLSGAPSAKINRGSIASSPMVSSITDGKTTYSLNSPNATCWLDLVSAEMATDADADLSVTATVADGKVSVPFSTKFAIDMEKQNVGLFLIVTEDNLFGYQDNYFSELEPGSGLEDWCSGGKYGQSQILPFMQNHVVRAQVGTYNGASGYIPADITAGEEYTGTVTFNVPTVNDINNCNVVCMMIDINTGRVINVAEAKITDPTGIGGINADGEGAEEVARYNAAGQMIAGPQKGLNIIKYADGTTRKVVVK